MQLANLVQIREELSREPSIVEVSSSTSGEIQSNPSIAREVRASMVVGGELDIQFLPNDDVVLKKMIELEIEEYARLRAREG